MINPFDAYAIRSLALPLANRRKKMKTKFTCLECNGTGQDEARLERCQGCDGLGFVWIDEDLENIDE